MDQIYYYIGFVFVWVGIITLSLILLAYLYEVLMNWVGRTFKSVWIILEFQIYKKEFKEWVKDKPRHKNMK